MTTQSQNTVIPATDSLTKVVLGNFGNGRYSPAMGELYKDSQRLLGFSEEQAHVTAVRLGVDVGQAFRESKVNIGYGKTLSKDGKRNLKEIVKAVKLTNSWAMSIGAICSQLDDIRKQGLVVNDCTVTKEILSFVDDAAARIEGVEAE